MIVVVMMYTAITITLLLLQTQASLSDDGAPPVGNTSAAIADPAEEAAECAICFGDIVAPWRLLCGHDFCEDTSGSAGRSAPGVSISAFGVCGR